MPSASEPLRVAVIGAGISGLAQAIRLKEALGKRVEVAVYERESRIGGVWRDSLWPNAGVDVPIHMYSLYSDLNPDWNSVYASQPEVLRYWEGLVDKHDLHENLRFNSRYVSSAWSEDKQQHRIVLASPSGEERVVIADVLISAVGPLAKPVIPNFPGLDKFKGSYFHNLRWDPKVPLEGKRVAVIGNGSSGIQLVPGVAATPGVTLTHYIRSGGYFVPKINTEYTPAQKFAFRWVPGVMRAHRNYLFIVHSLQAIWRINGDHPKRAKVQAALLEHLEKTAPPEYLHALRPNYPLGCKRLALDAGWLESLHRDNVTLTNETIVRITEDSIVTADGAEHKTDVIVFATGSDVVHYGVGLNHGLKGQDDLELRQYWDSLGGAQAYLGLAVPHFPNYFIVIGPNASSGSWGFTVGQQSSAIARIVKEMVENGLSSIQPKIEPFERHNIETQERYSRSSIISDKCSNWYRVGQGRIVVPNSVSSTGLWLQTRKTNFSHWTGSRVTKDGNLESVDVATVVRKRQLVKLLVLLALLIILGVVLVGVKSVVGGRAPGLGGRTFMGVGTYTSRV